MIQHYDSASEYGTIDLWRLFKDKLKFGSKIT
jgi:hypothetical protein